MATAIAHAANSRHKIPTTLLLSLIITSSALAGEPNAVNEALSALRSNWQDASFSIEVTGLADDAAVTGASLQVEYEAARKGYLTYLRVSSHGEILITRVASAAASDSGTLQLPIQAPLGNEQAIFLFSEQPLTALTGQDTTEASLGADRDHANSVVGEITQLQTQGLIALRSINYMVEAPAGQTQYTTRNIIRVVEANSAPGTQQARGLPTRIEFQFGSDRLSVVSQRDLDVFGAAILKMRDRRVLLEGYADALGTDQYDLLLSQRRAQAARRYLLESFGLPASQLSAIGKGKLGSPNEPEATRRDYRRVDFVFGARAVRRRSEGVKP
jgi:outer membrane protein OmpA-like peptidoglycan-associated protein